MPLCMVLLLSGAQQQSFSVWCCQMSDEESQKSILAGMDCPRVRYPQLNDVVEADLAEQGYQVLTDPGQQVDKVIQLYEVQLALPLPS